MGYLSYGHECIIYIVLLLVVCHLILDVIPVWYKRLCRVMASAPLRVTGCILIIIISFFLL